VRASGSGSRGQWHGASDWGRRRGATADTAHSADRARGLAAWLLGFPRFHTGSSSLAGPGSAGVMQGTLCTDRADLCPISSLSHGAASSSSRACFHLSRDGYCAGRLTSLHCHSLLTAPAGPAATAAAADGRPPAQPAEACPPVRQSATRQPRLLHVAACCCCGCRPPPLMSPVALRTKDHPSSHTPWVGWPCARLVLPTFHLVSAVVRPGRPPATRRSLLDRRGCLS